MGAAEAPRHKNVRDMNENQDVTVANWQIGPFVRPLDPRPVISPNPDSTFDCPIRRCRVKWEALHTFNPAVAVYDGSVYLLYRAEDDSGRMCIAGHTSRLGLAWSDDGVAFERDPSPVLYPTEDEQASSEWPGGCEDPRLVSAEDGRFVLTYTQFNGRRWQLGVATSRNLRDWVKHGPAFGAANGGRYESLMYKSGAIVSRVVDDRLVAAKLLGRYWMYWGEGAVFAATSTDLIHWHPIVDAHGDLLVVLAAREGKFDSAFPEAGPAAVLTNHGIVVFYNGKNAVDDSRDHKLDPGAYSGGQALFSAHDPTRCLDRADRPYIKPEEPFERSGQYQHGTTFTEGLVHFKGKWLMYYGCADAYVGVAICDPARTG